MEEGGREAGREGGRGSAMQLEAEEGGERTQ